MTDFLATNMEDVAKMIAEDLGVLKEEFIPKATNTATLRSSRSALSKWRGAAARAAGVPAKVISKRSKNSKNKSGGRTLRIGTLPVSAGRLNPTRAKKGYRLNSKRGDGRNHPTAFRVQGGRGGSFIAKRQGDSRYPIKSVTVPVEQHVRRAARIGTNRLGEQFPKEFERAIGVNLRRQAAKRRRDMERSARRLLARIR